MAVDEIGQWAGLESIPAIKRAIDEARHAATNPFAQFYALHPEEIDYDDDRESDAAHSRLFAQWSDERALFLGLLDHAEQHLIAAARHAIAIRGLVAKAEASR